MTDPYGAYHHGDLRAALLAEAATMIAEGGAASLTMRGIGRRLGVSRAAPRCWFRWPPPVATA
jgi:AcrR family transcriptional regulator